MILRIDTERDTKKDFEAAVTLLVSLIGEVTTKPKEFCADMPLCLGTPPEATKSPTMAEQYEVTTEEEACAGTDTIKAISPASFSDADEGTEDDRGDSATACGGTVTYGPDGQELINGIPWDARIHSGSHAKYPAPRIGWKLKRGVDPELVEQVEAELRAAMAAPAAIDIPASTEQTVDNGTTEAAAPPPPPAETEPTEAAAAFGSEQTEAAAPPPPPAETVGVTESVATGAAGISTYLGLIQAITKAQKSPGEVTQACKTVGLEALPMVANREDLVPQIAEALGL